MKKILLIATLAMVISVPAVIYYADANSLRESRAAVGISTDQAAAAAQVFLKENNLDWGDVRRVRHTVGVTANGTSWYAVEFERPTDQPGYILVHPETGEAEFPKPR